MWSVFGIKLQAFSPATVLKRDSSHGCFPVKFAKFLRTPILKYVWKLLTASIVFFSWLSLPYSFFCSGSNWNNWRMVEQKSSLSLVFSSVLTCLQPRRKYIEAHHWIIWLFIPFKTPKQTPASKTVYPYPILWGFVIWTSICAETVIWGPMKTFSKQWTISSILNSYDLYHQVLT